MASSDFTVIDGNEAGSWIEPELGEGGSVAGVVPDRFEAYARILHPARDTQWQPVRWAEVAAQTGREVHPLVQWESLVGSDSYAGQGTLWEGNPPLIGDLEERLLVDLCELLAQHTDEASNCFFGIWGSHFEDSFAESEVPEEQRLLHPIRDYTVLGGPLSAAADMMGIATSSSPELIWPADRAWFVGSEIDFDSTLAGGGEALIEAILGSPSFEGLEGPAGRSPHLRRGPPQPTGPLAARRIRVRRGLGSGNACRPKAKGIGGCAKSADSVREDAASAGPGQRRAPRKLRASQGGWRDPARDWCRSWTALDPDREHPRQEVVL